MRHDVLRAIFPGLPSDLRGSPYLASEEELTAAGLGSQYLMKCLTVTGGGCGVDAPVYLQLFIGKSLSFLNDQLVAILERSTFDLRCSEETVGELFSNTL